VSALVPNVLSESTLEAPIFQFFSGISLCTPLWRRKVVILAKRASDFAPKLKRFRNGVKGFATLFIKTSGRWMSLDMKNYAPFSLKANHRSPNG
jgi:hypothetical protein